MTAHAIFDVDIHDMPKYQEFMAAVKPALEAAGGRYLARGGTHKVYEMDWQPDRIVLQYRSSRICRRPVVMKIMHRTGQPTYGCSKKQAGTRGL
ncbi:MAG: DUF1330 domain-containing protein [Paracoccaceae bacterium]